MWKSVQDVDVSALSTRRVHTVHILPASAAVLSHHDGAARGKAAAVKAEDPILINSRQDKRYYLCAAAFLVGIPRADVHVICTQRPVWTVLAPASNPASALHSTLTLSTVGRILSLCPTLENTQLRQQQSWLKAQGVDTFTFQHSPPPLKTDTTAAVMIPRSILLPRSATRCRDLVDAAFRFRSATTVLTPALDAMDCLGQGAGRPLSSTTTKER